MLQHPNNRTVQKRNDSDIELGGKHFTAFLWHRKPFELCSPSLCDAGWTPQCVLQPCNSPPQHIFSVYIGAA